MMRTLVLSLLFICLPVHAQTAEPFTVVFLGDSLTEGLGLDAEQAYPSLIADRLHESGYSHVNIINAGISGSTSASALERMQWYIRSQPDLVFLALGANDGLRGLSVENMKQNLDETIVFARQNGVQVALAGMLIPPNMGKDYTDAFAAVFPTLAQTHDIPLMPFLLEDVAGISELNQADGIHPNVRGAEIVAEHVYDFLLPLLP